MNSMRFLMLLTFVLYEMQGAQSTTKHLNYLKSLLLSKHEQPSTTQQPSIVQEEEVYVPALKPCDPPAGDVNANNGAETPILWDPQAFLPNVEQKPVVIEIENVDTIVPSSTPAQVYGELPVVNQETPMNVQVNSEIVYNSPEAEYLKVYEKDMNPEWLVVDDIKDEQQKPAGVVGVKKGVASLKDKIRAKIMLIKSKLKAVHPEAKPVMEIVEQDSPFVSEQYFQQQHTTGKPMEPTFGYSTTGKPILEVSVTTEKPVWSTMESITTGRPLSTMESISTGGPYSTIESITTGRPLSTMESITTGRPLSTMESITTGRPLSTIESISTGGPYSSMESITTGGPLSTIESFTTGRPVTSTVPSYVTGKPFTSNLGVAGPMVMIKPSLKPSVFAQVMNYDVGSLGVQQPSSFIDLQQQLQMHAVPKVVYYSPLPYRHHVWQKPLTTMVDSRYMVPGYDGNHAAQTGYQNGYQQQPIASYPATQTGYQNGYQQQPIPAYPAVRTGYQNGYQHRPIASYPATQFGYSYYPSAAVKPSSSAFYVPAVQKSTATPMTLENTRYVQKQPPKLDDPSLTVKFENYYEGRIAAAPAPVAVADPTAFPYTGSYPSTTAQPSHVEADAAILPVEPQPASPAKPIAVYADEQQQPNSEEDWTRAIAAEQQLNAEVGGPLRGDIPYANEMSANKYAEPAAQDQTMAVASSNSAEIKVPAPTPAKIVAPVVEKGTEDEKPEAAGSA